MTITKLPEGNHPSETGWTFCGGWSESEQASIIQTLQERVPNRTQALNDTWLLIATPAGYYAHCPTVHEPGYGYHEQDVAELADTLWGHYFTLRLGPLVLATSPTPARGTTEGIPPPTTTASSDFSESYRREMQALAHFEQALALIGQGDYAATKREMQLSFELYPANGYYSFRRVETLGDIESFLGDDLAAEQHYERALTLATWVRETWLDTELRLKLAWCALRRGRFEQARAHIDAGIAACERGRQEDGGSRSLNAIHGLALATLADLHLHQLDLDTALIAAHDATAIASKLGQSYGEKARLFAYLAWQLYLHGETAEARVLAKRAWGALDQWMPVESAQTRAMRVTLTTILGGPPPEPRSARAPKLPPFPTLVASALAAARAMQSWDKQVVALHTLAPLLEHNQLQPPFDDIIVFGQEDRRYFAPYRALLQADFAPAMKGAKSIPERVIRDLIATDASRFNMLIHEALYAEALVRLRDRTEAPARERLAQRIEACAATWSEQLTSCHDDRAPGLVEGLVALLPHLQPDTRLQAISQLETHLLSQLAGVRYTPSSFLAALPVLARLEAGSAVLEAIVRSELRDMMMWVACLPHAVALELDELRNIIVESTLKALQKSSAYGSTTDIAEVLCLLAPYLEDDEIHQALALTTPARSIAPRVKALTALASALPSAEREPVLVIAWQAAARSKKADTTGEALVAIVSGIARTA